MPFPRTTLTLTGAAPFRQSVIDTGLPAGDVRGTIVLIHGAGGHAEQWRHQIEHFRPHYRVIAPDLRGHGQSERPRSSYSLEEFLWDLSQLLRQLAVPERFILLAHSFGGPIALTYAAANPERIGRLGLLASAPEMHLNLALERLLRLPLPTRTLELLLPLVYPKLNAPLFVIQRVLAGTLFPWRGWSLLPAVAAPTLLVGGERDRIVTVETLQRMRADMPQARLEVVRHAGHLLQLERPATVNRYLEGFLERRRSWRGEEEVVAAEPQGEQPAPEGEIP